MNVGPYIFGALAFAFIFLLVLVIRKMTVKSLGPSPKRDEKGTTERKPQKAPAGVEDAPITGPARLSDSTDPRQKLKKPPLAEAPAGAIIYDLEEEKSRLTKGLARTRGGFISKLGSLFKKKELDQEMIDQVEEILFTADIGVATTHLLMDGLRKKLSKQELKNPQAIWDHIRLQTKAIIDQSASRTLEISGSPFVILMVGVNGTGKTTTAGKLAARLRGEGHSVILAAADTFRAAAVEQLEVWGKRASCPVVKGKSDADPSSVVIDALIQAEKNSTNVVIADTAGRLHTKANLMEELKKIRRSISKRIEGAPHETFLVLDATTGQNAISQAKMFKEAIDISGIILTKLDGTAKGGVVLGISHELQLPIRFIGIGEQLDDLRIFDGAAFVDALYEGASQDDDAINQS